MRIKTAPQIEKGSRVASRILPKRDRKEASIKEIAATVKGRFIGYLKEKF